MYSSHLDSQDAARLTVADILSTMGSSVVEAMTPTTLSLLDGLTGVPTRTTPTLTPTTLRNIEQTFMDLAASQVSHEREAGFVPPMVPASTSLSSASSNYTVTVTTSTQQDVKPHWLSIPQPSSSISPPISRESGRRMSVGSNSSGSNSNLSSAAVNQTSSSSSSARRGGGRRKEDRGRDDVSEEELGKRLMRRERNKEAAARCRKRRLDHTMALQQETEVWEDKKHALQKEIHELQKQKEELEHLLESHRPQCKMMRKSNNFVSNKPQMLPAMPNLMPIAEPVIKKERIDNDESSSEPFMPNEFVPPSAPRPRPTSLPVASPFTAPPPPPRSSASWQEIAGIAITTPSTGIPGFNFDSLMEGGTGLTPVMPSPSCGTQQQRNTSSNSNTVLPVDLSSPDAVNRKLVSL